MDLNTQLRQPFVGTRNTKTRIYFLALMTLIPVSQALAGEVRVDVGVKHANVCLGTSTDPAAFGAKKTGSSGRVLFHDVQAGKVQVTVSKPGFKSQSREFSMRGSSSSVHAPIREGVGGATCYLARVQYPAVSRQKEQQNSYALRLDSISLNNGAGYTRSSKVKINPSVQGTPTHYRVSESPVFEGAQWQDYVPAPQIQLSAGKGVRTVYFQVRKTVSVGRGEIVRESTVASDDITVR